jgi:hypothetical protein
MTSPLPLTLGSATSQRKQTGQPIHPCRRHHAAISAICDICDPTTQP